MKELDYVILLFFIATMNTTYNSSRKYVARKFIIVYGKLLATRNEYPYISDQSYFHFIAQPGIKAIDYSFASIGNEALFTSECWRSENGVPVGNTELNFDFL
jgi:hypothetical protein